jgi:hypothetical protein
MRIEQYLEEKCPEWDSVYFEISDKQQETVAALFDKRRLSEMLAEDDYFDWASNGASESTRLREKSDSTTKRTLSKTLSRGTGEPLVAST